MTTEDLKNLRGTLLKMMQEQKQYREVVIRDFRCDADELFAAVHELIKHREQTSRVQETLDGVHVPEVGDLMLTLRPTSIVGRTADGVMARYWLGLTHRSNPVGAFITAVAHLSDDARTDMANLPNVPNPILPGAGEARFQQAHAPIPVFFPHA